MKKSLISIALVAISALAIAQPVQERSRAPREQLSKIREEKKQNLSEQLNLSDTQREQLKKEQEKALEKVLTPEQKKQLKELKDKQTARKDSAQKRQAARLKEALSLSDEQVVKLQAQQQNFQQSMRAMQRKAESFRDNHREQLRSLMEEQKKNLSQLLNAEQLEKYKRMMRDRMQEFRGNIEQRQRGNQERNRMQQHPGKMEERPRGNRERKDPPPPPPPSRNTASEWSEL